jgi:type II secretory pathway pseudopilin PulG
MLRRLRPPSGDEGVSLVETVVAMLVFGVFAVTASALLMDMFGLSRSNTQRVVAANLASQRIEAVQAMSALAIPTGTTPVPDVTLGGTTYTTTQTAQFVGGPSGGSVCTGTGSSLAYKLVSVSVTWPDRGTVKPVRADTLRAVGLGGDGIDTKKGSVAVRLTDAAGQARPGLPVVLSPAALSQTTDADGCVVWVNVDQSAAQQVSVSLAGNVGAQGEAVLIAPVSLVSGKLVRIPLQYAPKGALAATPTAPVGYPVPATLGLTLSSSSFQPVSGPRAFLDCTVVATAPQSCVSGSPVRTASALFPGLYGVWAGTCSDAKPAAPSQPAVSSGGTTSVSAPLGAVQAVIGPYTQTTIGTRTVYGYHYPDAGCPAGEIFPATVISAGERRMALPPGTWWACLNADGSDAASVNRSAVVTAGAVTVVVFS